LIFGGLLWLGGSLMLVARLGVSAEVLDYVFPLVFAKFSQEKLILKKFFHR